MQIQVNINSTVDSKTIRRETYNGREHWIVPSFTLPADVVMNGGLYPASEIDAHYRSLEGRLAPLGHPMVNGAFVSASSPEAINACHIGAWNRNVRKEGHRVYAEKWIDVEVAQRSEGGRAIIERCSAIERGENVPPLHTSVAVFVQKETAPEGAPYEWVARIAGIDHDAILIDEPGAATPADGVGMMVNSADAVVVNLGALPGMSYREYEKRLDAAARAKFGEAWIAGFTATHAVVRRVDNDSTLLYAYSEKDGTIVFADEGTPVEQETRWVNRMPLVNHVIRFFSKGRASLFGNFKEDWRTLSGDKDYSKGS